MRTFVSELKRAVLGRAFFIALIGAFVCVMLGAFKSLLGIFEVGVCPRGQYQAVFLKALESKAALFAVPMLAGIPFAASFASDLSSGFIKPYLSRTSFGSYIAGKGLGVMLSGGLAILLGLAAAFFTLFIITSPFEYPYSDVVIRFMPQILYRALLYFSAGCLWAGLGLLASAVSLNVFMAYAFPLIAYYLLIILKERYLRSAFFLDPACWLAPGADWPLNGWSAFILLLFLSFACFALFLLVGRARLKRKPSSRPAARYSDAGRGLDLRTEPRRVSGKRRSSPTALSQALSAAAYNFRMWRGNLRVLLSFVLAFILCFLLSSKNVSFAFSAGTVMQAFEPFIWTFGDADSVLMISLLLVLLFSDMPYLGAAAPYYLVRMRRRSWAAGQVIYVALATFLFMSFIFLVTTVICMRNSFIGNKWSETAAILGYSGAGGRIMLPAFVKTLEMSRPFRCAGTVFMLMLSYSLVLSLLMLSAKLKRGSGTGAAAAFVFSLYGFLLDPQTIKKLFHLTDEELYKANVVVGWLSPLNHATYHMHSFGYDLLPTLWQSFAIMMGVCVLLFFLSIRAIRRYNFNFSKGTGRF